MKRTQNILVALCLILGFGLVLMPDVVADAAHRVRMYNSVSTGHGHRSVIASTRRQGDIVVASGCVTRTKDMQRVAELCGPCYEALGVCVRAPKNAELKCTTRGWSRRHGIRETLHFSNGDHIHVHEDGLVDHDD